MKGYPVTIWFDSLAAAKTAAKELGQLIVEPRPLAGDIQQRTMFPDDYEDLYVALEKALRKPSLALELNPKPVLIPKKRKTGFCR